MAGGTIRRRGTQVGSYAIPPIPHPPVRGHDDPARVAAQQKKRDSTVKPGYPNKSATVDVEGTVATAPRQHRTRGVIGIQYRHAKHGEGHGALAPSDAAGRADRSGTRGHRTAALNHA